MEAPNFMGSTPERQELERHHIGETLDERVFRIERKSEVVFDDILVQFYISACAVNSLPESCSWYDFHKNHLDWWDIDAEKFMDWFGELEDDLGSPTEPPELL